ncbi:MAG: hypothetical protein AAF790_07770 [Planctomycetota bacterium]
MAQPGEANPYAPPRAPTEEAGPAGKGIGDDLVRRLIAGDGTEEIAVADVSDNLFYGKKNCRRLEGTLAQQAEAAGLRTDVYQAVYWWCIMSVPVVPRGVYVVIEVAQNDYAADCYRVARVAWDVQQVRVHATFAWASLLMLVSIIGSAYVAMTRR